MEVNMLNKSALPILFVTFFVFFISGSANALGLGEIHTSSKLNEPLRATIEIVGAADLNENEILIQIASQEEFDRLGVSRDFLLTTLKFTVDLKASPAVIYISTDKPVREPFLNFILDIQSPKAQFLKEYTVLLNPASNNP